MFNLINLTSIPKNIKKIIIVFIDFIIFLFIFGLFNFIIFDTSKINVNIFFLYFSFVYLIHFFIFFLFGIYDYFIRYLNLSLIFNFLNAIILSNIIIFFLKLYFNIEYLNLNFFLTFPPILFISLLLIRKFLSLTYEFLTYNKNKEKIIIYGAGDAGLKSLKILNDYKTLYFIDDDINKRNKILEGVTIKLRNDLRLILKTNNIKKIFIAIPSLSDLQRKNILIFLKEFNVEVNILPSLDYLKPFNLDISDFKNAEFNYILNRKNYDLHNLNKNYFTNKTVLISGGGGSIGGEITRQLTQIPNLKIIVLDHSEINLYNIKEEITYFEYFKTSLSIKFILGSILDQELLNNLFKNYKIDFVFHSAAYKHVEMSEINIFQTINNNFIGTYNLCKVSLNYKVKKFLLISTDKAVNPTNIMGASKRLSEKCLSYYSKINKTIFASVRFGNVIGSSGSAVPIFLDQIKKRKPIYVRGINTTRYFMTIAEAVSLVFKSIEISRGGETFILNMGKKIRIYDLARKIINLNGLKEKSNTNPSGDIEIKIVDLKNGEKEYEELTLGNLTDIPNELNIKKDDFVNPNFELEKKVVDYKNVIKEYNKSKLYSLIEKDVEDFKVAK
tara:strand:- start:2584 stop:4425 length:1842 start_codon:yes stop_codon:yes gene_type:complete